MFAKGIKFGLWVPPVIGDDFCESVVSIVQMWGVQNSTPVYETQSLHSVL